MKIYIVPNFNKSNTKSVFERAYNILKENGVQIIISENIDYVDGYLFLPEKEAFYECDVVIVIGGDGTLIHTAKKAAIYKKSVLGINCGRVGYLSGLEPENLDKLTKLISGEYKTEIRMILSASFENDGKTVCLPFLNDAVITRGSVSRMIDLSVGFGGSRVAYRADGVIISTSTGATAYSMAAGGPIVDPELDIIVVTPISAFSFNNRSIVLNNSEELTVKNVSNPKNDVYVSIDGEESYKIKTLQTVKITKSSLVAKLIRIDNTSFFDTLSEKFS